MKNLKESKEFFAKNRANFNQIKTSVVRYIREKINPVIPSDAPGPFGGQRYLFRHPNNRNPIVLLDIFANGEVVFIERQDGNAVDGIRPSETFFHLVLSDQSDEALDVAIASAKRFLGN